MDRIAVGDIRIAYRWDGPEDGPVVVMAHALGTSHRLWDAQVAALGDRFRVLRYDWRGHGGTDAPEGPYSLSGFVADAVGLLDALGLGRVHWVGISTGGMIGQGVALAHPERLASLALCNTTSQSTPWYRAWVAERQAVVRERGLEPVWDMTKRMWFTDAFVDAAGPEYQAVRDVFVRTPPAGYLGATSAVADLAYRDQLHRIDIPTLVLGAGDDPATPPEHSHAMHERIAGSRLVVLDGLRHFSNVEAPALFDPPLGGFLDEVAAR